MSYVLNPFTGDIDTVIRPVFEVVAVTIVTPNTWVTVPVTLLRKVSDVQVFDQANMEKLEVDVRIIGDTLVEIKSKKNYTYTIHIEGI
jgi:hypothetical protein